MNRPTANESSWTPTSACQRPHLRAVSWLVLLLTGLPTRAHASMFKGEALDHLADILAWVVLIVAPIVGIAVFWLVHILPEKIAEKRQHPQTSAIQTLCLLSLVFGGLLWPLAWLWAYSKPVLYRLAYGTDRAEHGHEERAATPASEETAEVDRLHRRIAELESRIASGTTGQGGKN